MASGKRHSGNLNKVNKDLDYSLDDAVAILKESAAPKFDETIDISVNLGVDPRHADQLVRGTISMPNGTGKEVSILVLAKGDLVDSALSAGADFAGSDEYLEKIKSGWTDVDSIIATPEMMPELGKLGRVLGPRGLMPNPKTGTVTTDVVKAVKEIKAGKIEYKVEKNGIVHVGVAKMSFDNQQIVENVSVFINAIKKAKPAAVKGIYMKKVTLSSTMGPGIRINHDKIS
ncbi:MAG: 50S ribosomal protein L1 [Candidatus Marinimicrobia bacterium]|nr:50S ribosomal protein L1 [Candidatus Neomarinimicrobiota bacterium]|tara:strand:- start:9135 stop:9824 length:690 start_codon:yes stop_codon:yes gene_type:complete